MDQPQNQILTDDAHNSKNFFKSDLILRHHLRKHATESALEYMHDNFVKLGAQAAGTMNELSHQADKNAPQLKKRSKYGEEVNEVHFHPAYWKLVDFAAESEMFYVKYDAKLRSQFARSRQHLGFAAGQLFAMTEIGVFCPLCMTDGAAHLVDSYAPEEVKKRLLPRLSARDGDELKTGAMFLTEKSGGSDVGRNLARADQVKGRHYLLHGEKWFCSNVNADVIMALARTGDIEDGTRALSLFLIEKNIEGDEKEPNPMEIIRLKDKLGVRSMATGEVNFHYTVGIRLGEEDKGFKIMTEMINISRTYNSIAAVGGSRRALIEAYQYLNHRVTFDKKAINHALIRQKFHELGSKYVGNFLLAWRAVQAMEKADNGDDSEQELMRMLVPMAKWKTAETGVYIARECMELMGGNGYIEDFVMPRLLRDINVLPIWEGSGNIIALDILRASQKSDALQLIIEQIEASAKESEQYGAVITNNLNRLQEVQKKMQQLDDRDAVEATAKQLFKELIHLYEMALMIEERDDTSKKWIDPALKYMASHFDTEINVEEPIPVEKVHNLVAWEY